MKTIIVAGFDNTGKTSLTKRLSDTLETPVINSLGPNVSRQDQLIFMTESPFVPQDREISLHERYPILEELVYGPPLRGHSNFTEADLSTLMEVVYPLIIYTRPPESHIFNWGDREQMPGVKEQAENLLTRWDRLMASLVEEGYNVFIYDYTNEPDEWVSLMKEVENYEKQTRNDL